MGAMEEIAEGGSACLIRAALEIAGDEYSELNAQALLAKLDRMARGFELYRSLNLPDRYPPEAALNALNEYFFQELGFRGSWADYYDPRNSYVSDVLERRVGIPISLSLVYLHLAEGAGVSLHGVNLPGHFMLAHSAPSGKRLYIDVYNGGQLLDWRNCCEHLKDILNRTVALVESDFDPMSHRDILVRILRNLKGIYSQTDLKRALRVQERLIRLLPDDPLEQRDLGVLYNRAGKPFLALRTFQNLLERHPVMRSVESVRDSLRQAAREAALTN